MLLLRSASVFICFLSLDTNLAWWLRLECSVLLLVESCPLSGYHLERVMVRNHTWNPLSTERGSIRYMKLCGRWLPWESVNGGGGA